MKRNYLRLSTLACMAVVVMASCSQDEVVDAASAQLGEQALTISVTNQGFEAADAQTRVSDNGKTTVFEEGDQMGLYVVENNGTESASIVRKNIVLTYTDGGWTSENTIYYYKNSDYIAYFPYNSSLSVTASSVAADIKSAFDTKLAAAVDQTEEETYRSVDLMMATIKAADLTAQSEDTKKLDFVLTHQYSMVEFTVPCHNYYYTKVDGTPENYQVPMSSVKTTLTTTASGSDAATTITPSNTATGTYRCIVNPGATISLSGEFYDPKNWRQVSFSNEEGTTTLEAGKYVSYNITYDGAPSATATLREIIGDYYCQDGSIHPSDFDENSIPDNVVGIIYSKVDATDPLYTTNGYNHYVLSVKSSGIMEFNASDCANIDDIPNIDSTSQEELEKCFTEFAGYASTQKISSDYNIKLWGLDYLWKGGNKNYDFQFGDDVANSDWFIASIGQWLKLENLLKLDTKFEYTYSNGLQLKTTTDATYTLGAVYNEINRLVNKLYDKEQNTKYNTLRTGYAIFWSSTQGAVTTTEDEDSASTSDMYCIEVNPSKYNVFLNAKTGKRTLCPIVAF